MSRARPKRKKTTTNKQTVEEAIHPLKNNTII
jgi:hypothetical protein